MKNRNSKQRKTSEKNKKNDFIHTGSQNTSSQPVTSSITFGIFVACIASLISYNSLHGDLLFDDEPAIIRNNDLRPNTSWFVLFNHDFWGTPIKYSNSNKSYRPLTVATFKLNYLWHELNPEGYHIINILSHGIVTFLFYQFCRKLFIINSINQYQNSFSKISDLASKNSTILCEWRALVASLLFALHPIHTEAIASVVGRAELLAAIFFMITLLLHVSQHQHDYHEKKPPLTIRSIIISMINIIACVGFAGVALLCKEQGITCLLICIFYDVINLFITLSSFSFYQTKNKVDDNNSQSLPSMKFGLISNNYILIFRIIFLFLGFFFLFFLRLNILGNTQIKVPFSIQNNPAAFSTDWKTRCLTFHYLLPVNMFKLMFPVLKNLCCDWSRESIPLVESFQDIRNFYTLLFWFFMLLLIFRFILYELLKLRKKNYKNHQLILLKGHSREAMLNKEEDMNYTIPLAMGLALLVVPFLPATNLFAYVGFVVAERVLYTPSFGYCLIVSLWLIDDKTIIAVDNWFSSSKKLDILDKKKCSANSKSECTNDSPKSPTLGPTLSPTHDPTTLGPTFGLNELIRISLLMVLILFYSKTTLQRNQDWSSKESLWISGLEVNPNNGMLWYNYGHELEDKATEIGTLIQHQKKKKNYDDDINDGSELEILQERQKHELSRAWHCFEQAAILDSYSNEANLMLGIMALRANQFKVSKEKFMLALNFSASANIHHNLAILLCSELKQKQQKQPCNQINHCYGDYDEILNHLRSAIRLNRKFQQAYEVLGFVLIEILEFDLSDEFFYQEDGEVKKVQKKEDEEEEEEEEVLKRIDTYSENEKEDNMIEEGESMKSFNYFELRKEAIRVFSEAYKLNPKSEILSALQKLVLMKTEDEQDEEELVSSSSSSTSSLWTGQSFESLQQCQKLMQKWDLQTSEECFIGYIRQHPKDSSGYYEYGLFMYNTGGYDRLKEAQVLFQQAFKLSQENNPNYGTILCTILIDLGFTSNGESCLEKVATQFNHANAYRNLGQLREGMGRVLEAQIAYEKADKIEMD